MRKNSYSPIDRAGDAGYIRLVTRPLESMCERAIKTNCGQSQDTFWQTLYAGTRITVQNVLELLDEGLTFNEILQDYYPDITIEDIRECVQYAK